MAHGYRLLVYKTDRRTKTGERFVKVYDYPSYSGSAMQDEIYSLKQRLYRPQDGWRLDFEPMTKMVKNFMTGEMIEIDYRTPYCADPSAETYWSN